MLTCHKISSRFTCNMSDALNLPNKLTSKFPTTVYFVLTVLTFLTYSVYRFDENLMLHAQQYIEFYKPLPSSASVSASIPVSFVFVLIWLHVEPVCIILLRFDGLL